MSKTNWCKIETVAGLKMAVIVMPIIICRAMENVKSGGNNNRKQQSETRMELKARSG